MAAYEVLLLNTAIPQIQAAQSGDTYVVPRDIAINASASITGNLGIGTNAAAKLDVLGPSADQIRVRTAGTEFYRFGRNASTGFLDFYGSQTGYQGYTFGGVDGTWATINSSGNLGLGVTPSAWGSSFNAIQIKTGAGWMADGANSYFSANSYWNGTNWIRNLANAAARYQMESGAHAWYTAGAGTAGNPITFTLAMTLDASGNLGIGTTNPVAIGANYTTLDLRGSTGGGVRFGNTTDSAYLYSDSSATVIATNTSKPMVLAMNSLEKARITTGGYFKASNDGSYVNSTGSFHELLTNDANNAAAIVGNRSASPGTFSVIESIEYTAAAPNNATAIMLLCKDNAANRLELRSNGGLANYQANDTNLSDQRVKKDIVAAPSYWDKIKGIEIVHFKYKDQTHDDNNVGVIAQQVEQVAPEFVDQDGWGETPEDGVPLKSIYTSDMYHAAIKALQEAMARIEQLEAKVASLGA